MLDGVGTTCNLTPIDWLQREWVTKNRAGNGHLFFFRCAEWLLWNEEVQTAYVSWNPARYEREKVFETFCLNGLKQLCYKRSHWFYDCYVWIVILSKQILPGVKVVIANPETKGMCADSHLGEVCQLKLFEATLVLAFLGATESCCISEWAFFSWIPLRHQTSGPWNVRIYLPCTNVTRVRLCPRRHTCLSWVSWFSSLLQGVFPPCTLVLHSRQGPTFDLIWFNLICGLHNYKSTCTRQFKLEPYFSY